MKDKSDYVSPEEVFGTRKNIEETVKQVSEDVRRADEELQGNPLTQAKMAEVKQSVDRISKELAVAHKLLGFVQNMAEEIQREEELTYRLKKKLKSLVDDEKFANKVVTDLENQDFSQAFKELATHFEDDEKLQEFSEYYLAEKYEEARLVMEKHEEHLLELEKSWKTASEVCETEKREILTKVNLADKFDPEEFREAYKNLYELENFLEAAESFGIAYAQTAEDIERITNHSFDIEELDETIDKIETIDEHINKLKRYKREELEV